MKKLLTLFLALSMLLSLAVPTLAVETAAEESYVDVQEEEVTPYDQGYEDGWNDGLAAGAEEGQADALALTPKLLSYSESLWSEEATYEDGYTEGFTDGRCSGYDEAYWQACGRYPGEDWIVLEKGGVPGQVNVMVEGQCIDFADTCPTIEHDRTMIPVRAVMETLDAEVDYEEGDQAVIITKDAITVTFSIGSTTYTVTQDGETTTDEMDTAAYIVPEDGRTMVPLRFLSEAFGYVVLWDSDYRTAVVVDDEALIAEVDSKFTYMNDLLAQQIQQQMGMKYHEKDSMTGTLTLYNDQGEPSQSIFHLGVEAYSDTETMSSRIDLSLDIKDTLLSVMETYPDLFSDLDVDLRTALETDLNNITATILLTEEGKIYLHVPLVNSLLLGASEPDKVWLELNDLGALGVDLTQTGETLTMGQALVPSLLIDQGSFNLMDNVDMATSLVEAMFGDATAVVEDGTYTWSTDLALMMEAMGMELTEEDLAMLDSFYMTFSMGEDASYTIDAGLDVKEELGLFFMVEASGGMEGGMTNCVMTMDELFELALTAESVIEEVEELPALTLPADAIVEGIA